MTRTAPPILVPPLAERAGPLSLDAIRLALDADSDADELRLLGRVLTERVSQLETALQTRVVIEQAKGVLAERLGVSLHEAFGVLRDSARASRTRIHDLAEAVIVSRETPPQIANRLGNGSRS